MIDVLIAPNIASLGRLEVGSGALTIRLYATTIASELVEYSDARMTSIVGRNSAISYINGTGFPEATSLALDINDTAISSSSPFPALRELRDVTLAGGRGPSDLRFLTGAQRMFGSLTIEGLTALSSLAGLEQLGLVENNLTIANNPNLPNCAATALLNQVQNDFGLGGTSTIDNNNGTAVCCASGFHDDGLGACVPAGQCASGSHHDGGAGICAPVGSCAPGFALAADGSCG
jgi:hypothetical protein